MHKAATDPKNWIRDPAGSDPDPDPDPLTHGTHSIGEKNTKNVEFLAYFLQILKQARFFHKNFEFDSF